MRRVKGIWEKKKDRKKRESGGGGAKKRKRCRKCIIDGEPKRGEKMREVEEELKDFLIGTINPHL